MSAKDEKKVIVHGAAGQIDPTGKQVTVLIDGQEVGSMQAPLDAPTLKPTDQQPGETRDKHFIRMFKGAFFGPNAMRNHAGRKLKKGKRK